MKLSQQYPHKQPFTMATPTGGNVQVYMTFTAGSPTAKIELANGFETVIPIIEVMQLIELNKLRPVQIDNWQSIKLKNYGRSVVRNSEK